MENINQERKNNLLKSFSGSEDLLEKGGKPGVVGEKRTWGGQEYIKTVKGWVLLSIFQEKNKEVETKQKKDHSLSEWLKEFSHLKLNTLPIGIPKEQVIIDMSGDIHSHSVMTWREGKYLKKSYTKEFLQRNAEKKWKTVSSLSEKQINNIKLKSLQLLDNEDQTISDSSAIIAIIVHTGLRRGNKEKEKLSGNKGVSTLSPENIIINGNKISFNFIGKSYKENIAEITNKKLADYLRKCKERDGKYLFNTNDDKIDKVFDMCGGEGLKVKDMRTYVACNLAKKILYSNILTPPPIPQDMKEPQVKKLIESKLKDCYEKVSKVLNNSPSMTKSSYIHPVIIKDWINKLNLNFQYEQR